MIRLSYSSYLVPSPKGAGCDIHEVLSKLVIVNLDANNSSWSFSSVHFLVDGVGGGDGGRPLVSDVEWYGEDKAVRVVIMILYSSLVPNLVSCFVINFTEVSETIILYQFIVKNPVHLRLPGIVGIELIVVVVGVLVLLLMLLPPS